MIQPRQGLAGYDLAMLLHKPACLAQAPSADTRNAVLLATLAARGGVVRTTPQAATGTFRSAGRADDLVACGAGDQVTIADDVAAAEQPDPMFLADRAATSHAACDANRAALRAAHVAGEQARGDAVAGRALHHAGGTVWRAIHRVEMVEARADRAPTAAAGHQAVLTEALAVGIAHARVRAELLTAGTTHRTRRADQRGRRIERDDAIGPQVAAALAHTTRRAFNLATVTDGIPARWADADMLPTSTSPARPAGAAAVAAIFSAADRAHLDATRRADQFVARRADVGARVASDMPVAVERHVGRLAATGIAGRSLDHPAITILQDANADFVAAIGERHFGHGDGRFPVSYTHLTLPTSDLV